MEEEYEKIREQALTEPEKARVDGAPRGGVEAEPESKPEAEPEAKEAEPEKPEAEKPKAVKKAPKEKPPRMTCEGCGRSYSTVQYPYEAPRMPAPEGLREERESKGDPGAASHSRSSGAADYAFRRHRVSLRGIKGASAAAS